MELEEIADILKKDPDKAVPELLEDIRRQYGEIPYIMDFMKDLPDIFIPKTLYDNSIMREFKNLGPETVELISIGVASALRCSHCLRMHIRIAKRQGVPKESIFYAIMIGASLSNAAVLAESTRALASEFQDNEDEKSQCCGPNCDICNISGAVLK